MSNKDHCILIRELIEDIANRIGEIKKIRYDTFFIGTPLEIAHGVYQQKVKLYSDEMLRFSRSLLPCLDGTYRYPDMALHHHLINIKMISGNSSTCSNIPYKFFKDHSVAEIPYDLRVIRILKHLENNHRRRKDVHRTFNGWNGRGGPDITDFGHNLRCVEIKMIGDQVTKEQKQMQMLLSNIGINTNVLMLVEEGRKKYQYQSRRRQLRALNRACYSEFLKTKLGEKVDRFINFHMKSCDPRRNSDNKSDYYYWKITSRRKGAENLITYFKRPSALVNSLILCLREERKNCLFSFTECEVVQLTAAVLNSGYLKWWIIPIIMIPWIEKGKCDTDYHKILRLCYEWEDLLRTTHIELVGSAYFRNNTGFCPNKISLGFSTYILIQMYNKSKSTMLLGREAIAAKHLYILSCLQSEMSVSARDASNCYP